MYVMYCESLMFPETSSLSPRIIVVGGERLVDLLQTPSRHHLRLVLRFPLLLFSIYQKFEQTTRRRFREQRERISPVEKKGRSTALRGSKLESSRKSAKP